MINLQNITKIYRTGDNETEVFRDFNLFVDDGEYVAVMGRSGSGKTTLLNIIGAMDGFDSGRYMYNDAEVDKLVSAPALPEGEPLAGRAGLGAVA